jgi:hypothetical protein
MTVEFLQGTASYVIGQQDVFGGGNPPTQLTLDAIVGNMTTYGTAMESSQWNGFVSMNSEPYSNVQCNDGTNNLSQSIYSVSNLRVKGSLVRGSASVCTSDSSTPR